MNDLIGLEQAIRTRLDRTGVELTAYDIAEITDVVEIWICQQSGGMGTPVLFREYHKFLHKSAALQASNEILRDRLHKALKRNTTLEDRVRWFGNQVRTHADWVLEIDERMSR